VSVVLRLAYKQEGIFARQLPKYRW